MGKYVVRRLLWMVVVLFFVSLITFLLAFAVPGDPAKSIAGTHATPEILDRIRHTLGLDEPIWKQYGLYLWHLVHGNMGYSYETQLPVTTAILQRFPATVMVAVFGIFFELLIGIPIGMTSALRQYGFRDRTFTVAQPAVPEHAGVLPRHDPHVLLRLQVADLPAGRLRGLDGADLRASCRGSRSASPAPPGTRACCAAACSTS